MNHFHTDNNCHSDLWSEGLPYLFIRKQSIGDSSELEKSVSACIRSDLLQVGHCTSYLQLFGLVLLSSCQLALHCPSSSSVSVLLPTLFSIKKSS